jgi:glutamate-1-semialdehyde 2,1-aminomutase
VKRFAALHHALLERGVYLPPSQFEAAFLSSEHGPDVLDQTANAFREAIKAP